MSWEELYTRKMICPCGKGYLTQTTYGDDWNRYKEGPIHIECEICNKNYRVEGSFLIPYDYPAYSGTRVSTMYPTKTDMFNMYNRDFVEYLIISYDYEELLEAKENMIECGAYKKLDGISKRIASEYKSQFNSQRVASIVEKVDVSIEQYHEYNGNHEARKIIAKQEEQEYALYRKEKAKYQIPIRLT
jgi:hypothetical protein